MISENRFGLSILFFVAGLLLIVGSAPSITGAFLGPSLQPLSGLASGIALMLGSLALFAGAKKKESRLENLLKKNLTARQKKGLRHYGEILLKAHKGYGKDSALKNDKDYRLELGRINKIISCYDSMSREEKRSFEQRFNIHSFKEFGRKIMSVDAPNLNSADSQKGRGNLRYIFDTRTKKYLGLAQHKKKSGYRWVK